MHEDLGVVCGAVSCELLDPLRRRAVLLGARRARDLLIRHVANEHMPERKLLLTLDRRRARRSNELLAHELAHAVLHGALLDVPDRGDGAGPEDLSDDGRVLQERLPFWRKRVEACGD